MAGMMSFRIGMPLLGIERVASFDFLPGGRRTTSARYLTAATARRFRAAGGLNVITPVLAAFLRKTENALRGEPSAFIRPASKRALAGSPNHA